MKNSRKSKLKRKSSFLKLIFLLILLNVLNVLDVFLTFKALEKGAEELNPIVLRTNFNVVIKMSLPLFYFYIAFICFKLGLRKVVYTLTISLITIYTIVVLNNLIVLISS